LNNVELHLFCGVVQNFVNYTVNLRKLWFCKFTVNLHVRCNFVNYCKLQNAHIPTSHTQRFPRACAFGVVCHRGTYS